MGMASAMRCTAAPAFRDTLVAGPTECTSVIAAYWSTSALSLSTVSVAADQAPGDAFFDLMLLPAFGAFAKRALRSALVSLAAYRACCQTWRLCMRRCEAGPLIARQVRSSRDENGGLRERPWPGIAVMPARTAS